MATANLAVLAGFQRDENVAPPAFNPAESALVGFTAGRIANAALRQIANDLLYQVQRLADFGETDQRARGDVAVALNGCLLYTSRCV